MSTWTGTETGYCRIITWELGCLGSINLPCDVDCFCGRDEWQIKEVVVTPGGVMTFDVCLCVQDFSECHFRRNSSDPGDWAI